MKKQIKNVRESGKIPRKSRNIPCCHLSSLAFLVRSYMVLKQGKSTLSFNYHTHLLYMGTSHSGSAGQILTLTHLNLWFKRKKPGRCGEANIGRRDSVLSIYSISKLDCRKRFHQPWRWIQMCYYSATLHALYCHMLLAPEQSSALCLYPETVRAVTE